MTSDAGTDFLARYGGVQPASPEELEQLQGRSDARLAMEFDRSLTQDEVAGLLQLTPSQVADAAAAGELYSYRGASGAAQFPDWQF